MTIGPVQLLVLGFSHPQFEGEIIKELERLRESDTIKVIDAIAVYKDSAGDLEIAALTTLSDGEAEEFGATIGALVGMGFDGEDGAEAGAAIGAAAAEDGVHLVEDAADWDVLADIPEDSAAAILMIEHHWAVPLRDAIGRAGGFRISDGFISPQDLVEVGLLEREFVDAHALDAK